MRQTPRPVRFEALHGNLEATRIQHFAHQFQVVVPLVDASQHRAEHFAAAVQVGADRRGEKPSRLPSASATAALPAQA
jgi:hypothetical protein